MNKSVEEVCGEAAAKFDDMFSRTGNIIERLPPYIDTGRLVTDEKRIVMVLNTTRTMYGLAAMEKGYFHGVVMNGDATGHIDNFKTDDFREFNGSIFLENKRFDTSNVIGSLSFLDFMNYCDADVIAIKCINIAKLIEDNEITEIPWRPQVYDVIVSDVSFDTLQNTYKKGSCTQFVTEKGLFEGILEIKNK